MKKRRFKEWVVFLWTGIFIFTNLIPVVGISAERLSLDHKSGEEETTQGNVMNLYDRPVGSVDPDGNITNLYGRHLGSVDKDGVIFNVSNIVIGKVNPEGKISNQSGTFMGSADKQGNVYNVSGRKIGEVRDTEDIHLIGGAARLLLF